MLYVVYVESLGDLTPVILKKSDSKKLKQFNILRPGHCIGSGTLLRTSARGDKCQQCGVWRMVDGVRYVG